MFNILITIFWVIWGSFLIMKDEVDKFQYGLLLFLYVVARIQIIAFR